MEPIKYDFLSLLDESIDQRYYFQTVSNRRLSHIYHTHDFYEMIIILEGEVVQVINNVSYKMLKGDCALLSLGDAHNFTHQSKDLKLLGLSVNTEEFERFALAFETKTRNCPSPVFSAPNAVNFIKPLAESTALTSNDCRLLLSFLLADFSVNSTSKEAFIPEHLGYAVKTFSTQENIFKSLDFFVSLSGYSYPHLYRLMKKYYSKTPHEFILNLKLEHAYKKLCYSDMALEEVAEAIGYKSLSHFHVIFKERYGISPATLRNSPNRTNTL